MLTNYHILKVKYLANSDSVKISSERFKNSVSIPMGDHGQAYDAAEEWLQSKGFRLIGKGEAKDGYYIITDTFVSFKGIYYRIQNTRTGNYTASGGTSFFMVLKEAEAVYKALNNIYPANSFELQEYNNMKLKRIITK